MWKWHWLLERILNLQIPDYFRQNFSIAWLLIPWPLALPGHQEQWYWLWDIGRSFYLTRPSILNICTPSVWRNDTTCKYRFSFLQNNSTQPDKSMSNSCSQYCVCWWSDNREPDMLPWWPLMGLLPWYPVMSQVYNQFEDWTTLDEINVCLISKPVATIWQDSRNSDVRQGDIYYLHVWYWQSFSRMLGAWLVGRISSAG